MNWFWLVLAGGICFLAGFALSQWSQNNYLVLKAQPKWRTACCIRQKFYYIVPEAEYVSQTIRKEPA